MLLLPIRTDRPRIRRAYLTCTLITICTLVQIAQWLGPEVTVAVGAAQEQVQMPEIIANWGLWGSHPSFLTVFTHMFVHGDVFHLAGNMLFLWIFGSLMEDTLRPWGFAALYFGGGLLAAAAHIGVSAIVGHDLNMPMIGASGAVSGVMGLFMLRFHKTKVQVVVSLCFVAWWSFWVRSFWALLGYILMELVFGLLGTMEDGGGVAHWAHIGGFLAGAIAAPFLGSLNQAEKEYITDDPETNVEYVRRGEFVTAEEKALSADPGNAYQMRRLARAYREAGEYEDATTSFQRSIDRFATRGMMGQAAEVYLELIAHNDAAEVSPEILLKLAQHLEQDHLAMAVWSYQALTLRCPTRPEAEYALLRMAILYSQSLHQNDSAIRCLQEFHHRYPQSEWIGQAGDLWRRIAAPP